ncbi:YciI family protein [Streptomyces piniterrae]|uniref:YciI family protein n=1 Tax=Streptomyces piniterrae TaxID=2571125 RepID=A0A4U0NW78_9ACTN|nr:YciI family protein [Streptomyces piniterrae]TJZ58963.1 YciI family protein [Streptomyces piniterrae]
MPKYVMLTYLPVGGEPMPEEVGARWGEYRRAITESGVLVANAGLTGTDMATTVRVQGGETQITDGPFAETKEYLAGFFLIEVEDLDEALKWAAEMPNSGYGPVEVRPVWGG